MFVWFSCDVVAGCSVVCFCVLFVFVSGFGLNVLVCFVIQMCLGVRVVVCVMVWFCYAYACLLKCVYVLCEVECDVVWFGFC